MSSFVSYHGKKFRVRIVPGSNVPPIEWYCVAERRIDEASGDEELFLPFQAQPNTVAANGSGGRSGNKRKRPASSSDASIADPETAQCGVILHANQFSGTILSDARSGGDFFVDLTAPASETKS